MRLPRALSRLSAATAPTPATATASAASWRTDDAIIAEALRAGAREHEIDAVLVQVRGTKPVPVPKAVTDEVRAAIEAVRAGGPVRFSTGLFNWGRFSPKP